MTTPSTNESELKKSHSFFGKKKKGTNADDIVISQPVLNTEKTLLEKQAMLSDNTVRAFVTNANSNNNSHSNISQPPPATTSFGAPPGTNNNNNSSTADSAKRAIKLQSLLGDGSAAVAAAVSLSPRRVPQPPAGGNSGTTSLNSSSTNDNSPRPDNRAPPPPTDAKKKKKSSGNAANNAAASQASSSHADAAKKKKAAAHTKRKARNEQRARAAAEAAAALVEQASLPAGWEEFATDDGRKYFYNTVTKKTVWERPTKPILVPLPPNWQEFRDDTTNRAYYFNNATQETVWDRPVPTDVELAQLNKAAAAVAAADAESDDDDDDDDGMDDEDDEDDDATLTDHDAESHDDDAPLPSEWQEFTDPNSGQKYYFNLLTQVTTWSRPAPPLPPAHIVARDDDAEIKQASERKAKEEADRKAKEEAERKAKEEADRKVKEEADRKAKEELARKAKEEADRKAKAEADRKAKEEAARKAKEEADRKAKEEADRKAKEEGDRKAKEELARKAKEEADRKAKEEADRKAKEEAARKAKEEADRKAKEEADRKAKEDAERKAKEDAERKAKEDAERKTLEEAALSSSIDALPDGWEEFVDDSSGRTYYHHAATQQTVWDRPKNSRTSSQRGGKSVQFKENIIEAVVEIERKVEDPLPEGWEQFEDPTTSRSYYFHAASGNTVWDRPSAESPRTANGDDDDDDDDSDSTPEHEQSRIAKVQVAGALPLPAGWEEFADATGRSYFFNSNTSTTTWERPVDNTGVPPGWEAFYDETSNKPYYHNASTGQTVWSLPTVVVATPAEKPALPKSPEPASAVAAASVAASVAASAAVSAAPKAPETKSNDAPPPQHKKHKKRNKGPPLPPESVRAEDSPKKPAATSAAAAMAAASSVLPPSLTGGAFPKPPPSIAMTPPARAPGAPPLVPPMPTMPPVERRPMVPPALSAAPTDVSKLIAMVSPRRPFPTEIEQMIEVLENKKKHDHTKDFELSAKLGQGAHAVVYHAVYKPTGAHVALKSVFNSSDEAIEAEIELHRLLRPHQNCLDYYGRYKKASALWMVLELAEVGSPIDLLRLTRKPLMDGEIGVIMRDVCDALRFMHSLNAVHRDVKSDNMLLTKDAMVKLADFGASKSKSDSTGNKLNTLTGTPYFIAPEVLNTEASSRKGYDEKVDIWSLGISTIEMADGEPPSFDAHPMQVLSLIAERPPPTAVTGTKRSGVFNAFVARCLVKDPAGRATAAQLCADTFVMKAPPRSTLLPRISEFLEIVQKAGGRAAATNEWRASQKPKPAATAAAATSSAGGKAALNSSGKGTSATATKRDKGDKGDKSDKAAKKDKKAKHRAADAETPTASKLAQVPMLSAGASVDEAKQSLIAMSKSPPGTPKTTVTVVESRGRGATTTAAVASADGGSGARAIKRSSSTSRLPSGGQRRNTASPFV